MRITIIPSDQIVMIDYETAYFEDWTFGMEDIHAVQWWHTYGTVEPVLGAAYAIPSIDPWQHVVDAAIALLNGS
jgi:hypothetical protein